MKSKKYNPSLINSAFQFLIDEYGYSIAQNVELKHDDRTYAFVVEYIGCNRRVLLIYDYKDNFFDFVIIRRYDTLYPNDSNRENAKPFWELFHLNDSSLEFHLTQPLNQSPEDAIILNAVLLRKYGSSILSGERWY